MSRLHSVRGVALALGVVGLANSCSVPYSDLVAPSAARGDMFDSYVAIGNSITAGFQSSGIIDSTQRRSYGFLLGQSMGTRFAYPSLAARGCPPLITSFLTQTRPAGTTATTCDLRANNVDVLNNVAVPGAWSGDPSVASSANSTALTTIFLGGKTQVQKALEAKPTFVSVWIGNNDVLGPAISSGGTAASLTLISTAAAFAANYDSIINPLIAANTGLKGVLIGVVNVKNAPIMFPASALSGTGNIKAAFDAIACGAGTASTTCVAGASTLDASCTSAPGTSALINTFLAFQIRINAHPAIIACTLGGASGLIPAPVGDAFVLTTTEQATVTAAVGDSVTANSFNKIIYDKAKALGWAYYDPNAQLVALRGVGTVVRNTPLYSSAGAPFGTGMSLDGVHPAAAVHLIIANDIIAVINAKYGTKLPTVF